MQTGPGLSLWGKIDRRRSRPWAVVLFLGYFAMLFSELSMIRFVQGEDGRWVATTLEQPGQLFSLTVTGITLITLLAAAGFVYGLVRERNEIAAAGGIDQVGGEDLVYVFAWLHAWNTCVMLLYGLFVPQTLFAEGTPGSFLESAYLQVIILFLVPLWFSGRWSSIGLRAPVQGRRMVVTLLVLLVVIVVGLDVLVTHPVAEWFHLSLESEREKQIENEIVQAKNHHVTSIIMSLLVIGILVPFAEEILFRGVVQTYLTARLGALAGIIISSLWFALMHVDLALFAPLFAIGLGLGYLRHRFQSLWGAVILHAVNNMAGVIYYFA